MDPSDAIRELETMDESSESRIQSKGTSEVELRSPAPAVDAPRGLDPEDRRVIEDVQRGDSSGFRLLIEKYQQKVANLIYRFQGGRGRDLEDHCQEVFVRVYRGLERFQGDAALGTWIHRITLNYLIGQQRKRTAKKRDGRTFSLDQPIGRDDDFVPEVSDHSTEPSHHVQNEEKGRVIQRAIEALEADLRQIVVLREMEQMSYEDIAEVLSIPIGTVRSRLHRARGILQERLAELL